MYKVIPQELRKLRLDNGGRDRVREGKYGQSPGSLRLTNVHRAWPAGKGRETHQHHTESEQNGRSKVAGRLDQVQHVPYMSKLVEMTLK